jgi:hypothetical protein
MTVEDKWARRDKEASICRYRRKPSALSARCTTNPSEGAKVTRNNMCIGTNARGETMIEDSCAMSHNGGAYVTWPEPNKGEGHVAERSAVAPRSPRRPLRAPMHTTRCYAPLHITFLIVFMLREATGLLFNVELKSIFEYNFERALFVGTW